MFSNPFSKWEKVRMLDMRKDFLTMSNFYLVEILSKPNSLTIATSKTILKMSNYVLILSFFSHNENQEFEVLISFFSLKKIDLFTGLSFFVFRRSCERLLVIEKYFLLWDNNLNIWFQRSKTLTILNIALLKRLSTNKLGQYSSFWSMQEKQKQN